MYFMHNSRQEKKKSFLKHIKVFGFFYMYPVFSWFDAAYSVICETFLPVEVEDKH